MKIDLEQLEKTLILSWSSFIDPRQIIAYLSELGRDQFGPSIEVKTVSVSRFELVKNGFTIWLDYKITEDQKNYKATSEVYLGWDGNLVHNRTIRN